MTKKEIEEKAINACICSLCAHCDAIRFLNSDGNNKLTDVNDFFERSGGFY